MLVENKLNLKYSKSNNNPLICNMPLGCSDASGKIDLKKGAGPVTFTRNSGHYVTDHENIHRRVANGCAAFPGSRIVTNLLTYSGDLSNAAWSIGGTATKNGNTISFPANNDNIRQTTNFPIQIAHVSITCSGSGTVTLLLYNSVIGLVTKQITLTSIPTRYSFTYDCKNRVASFYIQRSTGDTATSITVSNIQFEDVISQSNQNPGEYIPTTSVPVTRCFNYLNPYTVDANGVVTDSGVRTPISNIKGILLEPASTNKCTNYSVIPGDTLGSTLSSGNAVVGKVYQIVTRTSIDWEANGTRLSGTANAVGATYRINTAITFTANDTAKLVDFAIGTTASSLNPTAIPGMILSGYTQTSGSLVVGAKYRINSRSTLDFTTCGSANNTVGTVFTCTVAGTLGSGDSVDNQSVTLSIVDDTAALQAAGLYGVTGAKAYKLDNSLGGKALDIVSSGTTGNMLVHSASAVVKTISGQIGIYDGNTTTFVMARAYETYTKIKGEGKTPSSTASKFAFSSVAETVAYLILNQFEEQSYCTSLMPTAGASATRAATVLSIPKPSNPKSGYYEFIPSATGSTTRWRWASYTDANNAIGVLYDGTTLTFRKRVAGTNYDATIALTETAGTKYKAAWRINADNSIDIFCNGTKGTGNANTTAPVWGANIHLGQDGNGANYGVGSLGSFRTYSKPLSDSRFITMTA